MHPLMWFNLIMFIIAWMVCTWIECSTVQLRHAIWPGFQGAVIVMACLALAEFMAYNVTYG